MKWYTYGKPYPPLGVEVIAQHDDWICEDFNPKGIRVGFLNEWEDERGTFMSAKWCNDQDHWHTVEDEKPQRWCHYPNVNKNAGNNG